MIPNRSIKYKKMQRLNFKTQDQKNAKIIDLKRTSQGLPTLCIYVANYYFFFFFSL